MKNIFSFSARVSESTSQHAGAGQPQEGAVGVPVLRGPGPEHHDPLLAHLPPPHRQQELLHQRLLRTLVCR